MRTITNVAPRKDNRRKKSRPKTKTAAAPVKRPAKVKIKDKDIRSAFHTKFSQKFSSGSIVIDEFNIGDDTRADIVIASDFLYGLEIKSEADTLDRLPKQVVGYDHTCDRPGIIVHESHLKGATEIISPWWDIYVATGSPDKVILEHARKGWTSEELNPIVILNLLWRRELATAYRRYLATRSAAEKNDREFRELPICSMKAWQLLRELSNVVTPEQAIQMTVQLIKERAEGCEWFRTYSIV